MKLIIEKMNASEMIPVKFQDYHNSCEKLFNHFYIHETYLYILGNMPLRGEVNLEEEVDMDRDLNAVEFPENPFTRPRRVTHSARGSCKRIGCNRYGSGAQNYCGQDCRLADRRDHN